VSCETDSRNATPPSPAIAPGAPGRSLDDVLRAAEVAATRYDGPLIDPRVPALVPGFDAPFFQAGLAGYSDAAMRLVARRHGCPFCVTEALLDRTLLAGGRGFAKADLGELHDNVPGGAEDRPLACQIMGSDPREMAAAALKAVEQAARSEKAYRALAYADGHTPPPSRLRLPGGIQLPPFDPSEGLGDDEDAIANACEDSCDAIDDAADLDLASDLDAAPIKAHSPLSPVASRLSPRPSASCLSPDLPSFATIDVNLACPVKKISAKARGGHWLAEPRGAIKLLEAVRESVPANIACTVKMRRSFDDTTEMVENFHTIYDAAHDMGYAWATVHARTVEQKYVGPSRWVFLKELVERNPDRLIFGSGDIWEAGDVVRMLAYAKVTGAAVARGCIGNPWLFRQARELLQGRPPSPPTLAEQRSVLLEHFRLELAVMRKFRRAEEHASKNMRKFAIRFATHHPRADEVRVKFIRVSSLAQWQEVVKENYPEASQ
jgi:tRNA-dihydrouridine synthase